VGKHWRDLSRRDQADETDAQAITRFAKSLAPRIILRHHIAGDIGAVPRSILRV